jgi:hypothetical protein
MGEPLFVVYFFGGAVMVLAGAAGGGSAGAEFAGLGLCIAGGCCLLASAVILSRRS